MKRKGKIIFTIGHGNRKTAEFLTLLKKNEIAYLVDVRTYPYSRFNPQYRRLQLEANLKSAGMEYLFLGAELGGRPQNADLYNNGKVSYPAIKLTHLFQTGIKKIIELANQGIKVALMCSESDQNQCHRKHLIADELVGQGIEVVHINKFGELENNIENHYADLFN